MNLLRHCAHVLLFCSALGILGCGASTPPMSEEEQQKLDEVGRSEAYKSYYNSGRTGPGSPTVGEPGAGAAPAAEPGTGTTPAENPTPQ
jgi:hypothetical protein